MRDCDLFESSANEMKEQRAKQKRSVKIRYTCDECGDIFYHTDEACRHIYADHTQENMSTEELLDFFSKSFA